MTNKSSVSKPYDFEEEEKSVVPRRNSQIPFIKNRSSKSLHSDKSGEKNPKN